MYNTLTIKQKILFGFSVVLLAMVGMAVAVMSRLNVIEHDLIEIVEDLAPEIVIANQVAKSTLDNGRLLRSAILDSEAVDIGHELEKLAANRKQIQAGLARLGELEHSAQGKVLLGKVVADVQQLDGHFGTLLPLLSANRDAEAYAYLKASFAPVNNRLAQALDALISYQQSEMKRAEGEAERSYLQAEYTLLGACLLALVLGISIGWWLSSRIAGELARTVTETRRIASGDLGASGRVVDSRARDECAQLVCALEQMRVGLVDVVREIQLGARTVADSAQELSAMSEEVAACVQNQADSTTSATATLEQLSVSINHVADNTGSVSERAGLAGNLAERGSNEVMSSAQRIAAVSEDVRATSGEMDKLTREVQEIGNIVTVIRDVADQTNLLALNAAIEAARAGETGRGFAVVADEVRKLAERTTLSAQEITRMVSSIQQNAGRVVDSMQQSRSSVTTVSEGASKSSEVMREVRAASDGVLQAIGSINRALSEQRTASHTLAQNMERVSLLAEQNSATVEELATTSTQLMNLSQDMQGVVARFRL